MSRRRLPGRLFALLVLAGALLTAPSPTVAEAHEEPCGDPPTAECLIARARALLDAGGGEEAVHVLKHNMEIVGSHPAYALLLARAYQLAGNLVWARRTLTTRLRDVPDDCTATAWLVWLTLLDGDLASARDLLDEPPGDCPATPLDEGRWDVLRAAVASEGDEAAAEAALDRAWERPTLYAEDVAMARSLQRRLRPLHEPPLQGQIDLMGGWSENPLLGSPLDPARSADDAGGPLVEARAWTRLGRWVTPWLFPFGEIRLKGIFLANETARDLSYTSFALLPGVAWDLGDVVLRTAYRYDALLLAGGDRYGDGPLWFFEGHRGELELDVASLFTVFGGAGGRTFREKGRTRVEADLGVGSAWSLLRELHLVAALSGRVQRATNPAYHLWGGTALAALQYRFAGGWTFRGMVSLGFDLYPDSGGYFATADARQELLVKGSLSGWTPELAEGLALGFVYEPARRFSTADAYAFTDHRMLLQLRWRFSVDPWAPEAGSPEGHLPLDYGLEGRDGGFGERVQDLLRQDEEAQRGSSCVE